MVIGDGMEVLLGIKCTPKEKSQVAISSLDDVCDLVYGLTAIEGVLVSETVFDDVSEYDARTEGFGNARKKSWVDDRGAAGIRGRRRWLPELRRYRSNT
jgi:hypothetical protein